MATEHLKDKAVKFGSGQPTNRGGRPQKLPFVDTLLDWFTKDGKIEFHPSTVKLLENGNYQITMPTQQTLAVKFMQMCMKGNARYMEMYFKLFGEYQPIKHDVEMSNKQPFQSLDHLTDEEKSVLSKIYTNKNESNFD
jgi:hypothetical protein